MEGLFNTIPRALNEIGPNEELGKAMVFAAWSRCAGELLSRRTAPLSLADKRLVIGVADETWKRHLEDLCGQLIAGINGLLGHGTVSFIEFRVDPAAAVPIAIEAASAKGGSDGSDVPDPLSAAANAISDERLREQFLSAAAAYLAKQKENIAELPLR